MRLSNSGENSPGHIQFHLVLNNMKLGLYLSHMYIFTCSRLSFNNYLNFPQFPPPPPPNYYPGGGYSPIWADRDVPPGRAGFWAKNSLKTGLSFPKSSVKAGFAGFLPQNAGKTGSFWSFRQKILGKTGVPSNFPGGTPLSLLGSSTPPGVLRRV